MRGVTWIQIPNPNPYSNMSRMIDNCFVIKNSLIFKRTTKLLGKKEMLKRVYCWIMYYNIVIWTEKNFVFTKKRFTTSTEMRWGHQNPSRTGTMSGMSKVTCKYIKIGIEDEKGKTCPHPIPLSCLICSQYKNIKD